MYSYILCHHTIWPVFSLYLLCFFCSLGAVALNLNVRFLANATYLHIQSYSIFHISYSMYIINIRSKWNAISNAREINS